MAVPFPPPKVKPRLTQWRAGDPVHRVCRVEYRPTEFNGSGAGANGRFHFFFAGGAVVPVLYGAESEDAAIAETVFRGVRTDSVFFRARLGGRALVAFTPERDLTLVELHGAGLQRLNLLPDQLTSAPSSEYPKTTVWAQALHSAAPEADGLVWMSYRFNTSRAMVLFGDRVAEDVLTPEASRPLTYGKGFAAVERCASAAGITIL